MTEWKAMDSLKAAHHIGLEKLSNLAEAVQALSEGRKAEALEIFEAAERFFEDDLELHFRHEEQALFPSMARVIGRGGPVQAMVEEHESIWRAVDSFVELVQKLKTADESALPKLIPIAEREVAQIRWILSSHIQKEDSMLFPLAEKTLDQAGRQDVDESVATLNSMHHPR